MANFSMTGLDDLISDIDAITMERLAPIMLEEASPILKREVMSRANAHRDSGHMADSIKATKANRTGDGYSIVVRPTGKDSKTGVRNMEKMAYLEYGTSKQAATPVISPAVRASENEVVEKMQEVFNREVDKL